MRTVLAALDAGTAARSVLTAALAIGELTGVSVEAVHVSDGSAPTPAWVASEQGIDVRIVDGPAEAALLDAVADGDVIAGVFGARAAPGGHRPVGRTALHVLERTRKPIIVVPADAFEVVPHPIRRVLVPLEGSEESSRPVAESLYPLIVQRLEVVVLHVFTKDTVPRVLDRPQRDLTLWADEFIARFCPDATRIELRSGSIGARVAEVCDEQRSDLVVLSWSQNAGAGRAAVVRNVLGHCRRPVLLLPVRVQSADLDL